jgi:hypothetical protein
MAHFAELNPSNVVLRVIVVATEDNSDANGVEKEYIGAAFCERLLGGRWKQTSYNGNMRKNFAIIGSTYDEQRDAYIYPQPYPSWLLNEDTCKWEAPVPQPDGFFVWDETTQAWT